MAFAVFYLWAVLVRPLLNLAGGFLLSEVRDLLASMLLIGGAYIAYENPQRAVDSVLALAGGVTLLLQVVSTLQEYRSRDTQAIALSQRRRVRTPGPR